MEEQSSFVESVQHLLDKHFREENIKQADQDTTHLLQDLEWEDIIEWANQYLLKLKRIRKNTGFLEINQSICQLIKAVVNCFPRFTQEEKDNTESMIIIQSLDLLVRNNFKQNIEFCLALTQIIVEKNPQNLEILYLLCTIYCKTKQYNEAMRYLAKCKDLSTTSTQKYNIQELEQTIQSKLLLPSDESHQNQDSLNGLRQSCYIDVNDEAANIDYESNKDGQDLEKHKTQQIQSNGIDTEHNQLPSPEKNKKQQQQQQQQQQQLQSQKNQKILYYNDEWEEADRYGYFQVLVYSYKKLKSKLGSCQKRKKKNTTNMFPQSQPTQQAISTNELSQQRTNHQLQSNYYDTKSPDNVYYNSRSSPYKQNEDTQQEQHEQP